jgi:hypothetical protein
MNRKEKKEIEKNTLRISVVDEKNSFPDILNFKFVFFCCFFLERERAQYFNFKL